MGISTIQSYRGAQIFEAIGLNSDLVDRHFTGTPSRLEGIGLAELAAEALNRHARAYPEEHGLPLAAHVEDARLPEAHELLLPQGGVYQWRRDGELHMWEPETVSSLQHFARNGEEGAVRALQPARRRREREPLDPARPARAEAGGVTDPASRRSNPRPIWRSGSPPAR